MTPRDRMAQILNESVQEIERTGISPATNDPLTVILLARICGLLEAIHSTIKSGGTS